MNHQFLKVSPAIKRKVSPSRSPQQKDSGLSVDKSDEGMYKKNQMKYQVKEQISTLSKKNEKVEKTSNLALKKHHTHNKN